MYRHGIICSEKTHFYFKGGGSSRILSTFLKMSFIALLTATLCLSVSLRSYRNHKKTCRTLHASKMNPLIITRLIII